MRSSVSINLASEPFRSDRPFLIAATAGGVLLAALLVFQVSLAWIQRGEAGETRAAIDQMSRQLRTLAAEQARLEAVLRRPEYAEVIDYSIFLNNLLLRKGISWTRIFSDLEQVMPHNVRLIAIRPQITQDNLVQLDMTVGAQTAEPVIRMVMELEGSSLFGATSVSNFLPPSQSDPLFRYRITANYAPKL